MEQSTISLSLNESKLIRLRDSLRKVQRTAQHAAARACGCGCAAVPRHCTPKRTAYLNAAAHALVQRKCTSTRTRWQMQRRPCELSLGGTVRRCAASHGIAAALQKEEAIENDSKALARKAADLNERIRAFNDDRGAFPRRAVRVPSAVPAPVALECVCGTFRLRRQSAAHTGVCRPCARNTLALALAPNLRSGRFGVPSAPCRCARTAVAHTAELERDAQPQPRPQRARVAAHARGPQHRLGAARPARTVRFRPPPPEYRRVRWVPPGGGPCGTRTVR